MNNEQLTSLIKENLTYTNKTDTTFEINSNIPANKITKLQIEFIKNKGFSILQLPFKGQDTFIIFGLDKFLEDSKKNDSMKKLQEDIFEDYKNSHLVMRYKDFITLGSTVGSVGFAMGGALAFATSPISGIALGMVAFSLAYYDTRKHAKEIAAKQIKACLDYTFNAPENVFSNIKKMRERYLDNNSKHENNTCTL